MTPANPVTTFLPKAWAILQHQKRKMAVFFVAALVAVALVTFLSAPVYRSQAKLLVRLGRENATLDPAATLGQASVVAVPASREEELNSIAEVLSSRSLLEKVLDSLGPEAILGRAPPEPGMPRPDSKTSLLFYKALDRLKANLDVQALRKSDVILLSCDGPSPETAQQALTRLIEYFFEEHSQFSRNPRTAHLFGEQVTRLREELQRSEKELEQWKTKSGLAVPEEQQKLVVNRVGRLEDELLQARSSQAVTIAEVQWLRDRLARLPKTQVTAHTTGMPNQAADGMRNQLYLLQLKELELLSKYPAEHPEVQMVRKQLAAAQKILDREEGSRQQSTNSIPRVYEETQLALLQKESLLVGFKVKIETVEKQLAREQKGLQELNAAFLQTQKLQREIDLLGGQYRRAVAALEQTQIDQAMKSERISNINVVQPPTYDLRPVRPRKRYNFALGLLFAVAGSVSLGVLCESLTPPNRPEMNLASLTEPMQAPHPVEAAPG
jgi:uncharacterized protein involved in exopolysaccharide biosynthesis